MSSLRELEIRQEARFVLWALRSAIAGLCGDADASADLVRGFALAGVSATTHAFGALASELFASEWSVEVWHGPRCCCVSAEEVFVLNALAEAAERQRLAEVAPAHWWRLILPAERVAAVDDAARTWLHELAIEGVVFPGPELLHSCLRPLENIAGPVTAARVH
jgi:hypothetical protein